MTCIITGCALVDSFNDRAVWGDLHLIGTTYVFNACLNGGEAAWQSPVPNMLATTRAIELTEPLSEEVYFERRAVIIVSATIASMNEAAQQHVEEAMRLRGVLL